MLSKQKTIPIIFGLDANYLKPMCVTISSLLRYAPADIPRPIEFYVLIDDIPSVSEKIISTIFRKLGAEVTFIKTSLPSTENGGQSHHTKHMYYRYLIPPIFSDFYEKAIYLDADLIIQGNIFSVFDQMKSGDALAATVEDTSIAWWWGSHPNFEHLDIPHETYFNSGVIGFNFENLPSNFFEKCLFYTKPEFQYPDQDALNVLVIKENLQIAHLSDQYNRFANLGVSKNHIVIHYIGTQKPWRYPESPNADLWREEEAYLTNRIKEKLLDNLSVLFWNLI
ncbi:hypothetical protein FAI41_03385 [Acetobacteraceae bacterium]|nr:hypothetical protein FAI41_03385 [Acetobacteraceae bacterium]